MTAHECEIIETDDLQSFTAYSTGKRSVLDASDKTQL